MDYGNHPGDNFSGNDFEDDHDDYQGGAFDARAYASSASDSLAAFRSRHSEHWGAFILQSSVLILVILAFFAMIQAFVTSLSSLKGYATFVSVLGWVGGIGIVLGGLVRLYEKSKGIGVPYYGFPFVL